MKSRLQLRPFRRNAASIASIALGFISIFALLIILSHGCSLEEGKSAGIRGHTDDFLGVEHGAAAEKGARFCQDCHGEHLAGGANGEPSCFQCHGLNWLDRDPEVSEAPSDHTIVNGIFHHHPSRETPSGTCTNCHGSSLEGDKELVTPSCYLCHGKEWD